MYCKAMEDEFDVVVEDGSAEPLARDIISLWAVARLGDEAPIREWEARADKTRGKKVEVNVQDTVAEAEEGDDDDWEEEDEEGDGEDKAPRLVERVASPKPEPIVDDDGFTLVQGKGKGRR
jgi:pre-rRNA-processing protein TSR2